MDDVILSMRNIHKRFPGVYALKDAKLDLKVGEVHALLGENGAGKSTLMKILGGIYQADEGDIYINGKKVDITGVHSAHANGISIIHQELCLAPNMSVAENIFLGREDTKKGLRFVNFAEMNKKARNLMDSLGLRIEPTDIVGSLSVAQQQMIEIVKALSVGAKILVMDEPTASLSKKEVEMLFETIEELKRKGISIIYISHRMEELFRITDRITVMRDGQYIGTKITKETTRDELITMMVGRELKDLYVKSDHEIGEVVLEVKDLNKKGVLNNINFSLRKGEILGIAGLVGAGRTELARVIFGIDKYDSGVIQIEGKEVKINSPLDAMNNGIGLVPEDRKKQGLVLIRSIGYNVTLPVLSRFIKGARVNKEIEEEIVQNFISKLSIKTPSMNQAAKNLSGGNQQKVVIAKWLATNPKVLILDEPTRGVDVGAKAEIYGIISMLAKQGVGIIMISSELPEIINMSDRVLVMHQGSIAGELKRDELNQERIMHYATGGMKNVG